MGARVRVKIERDGKEYIRSMSLLETVEEPVRSDGLVYYRFPRKLRELIADSSIFARLQPALSQIFLKVANTLWLCTR